MTRLHSLVLARRIAPVFLLALLVLAAILACSSQSPNIGRYYKGRILHVSVADLQRTDELRWTTSTRYPTQGAVGEPLYKLAPQSDENELDPPPGQGRKPYGHQRHRQR